MCRRYLHCLGLLLLATGSLVWADRSVPLPILLAGPDIHGLANAELRPDGGVAVHQPVTGTGHIQVPHLLIEDVLSPGHSPGCISFGGDVTLSLTSTLMTEIGGPAPCTGYDRIQVADLLTINSATLEIILINGFVPAFGDAFDIMDWGSITGTFGTLDTSAAVLPFPLAWDFSKLYTTGELVVNVQLIADGDLAPWNSPDGLVNAADVLVATQLISGLRAPGALQLAHGDMDGDGTIDLGDLVIISQLVLQL
jgi:hypothetical protein